jgi:hypothetical protein
MITLNRLQPIIFGVLHSSKKLLPPHKMRAAETSPPELAMNGFCSITSRITLATRRARNVNSFIARFDYFLPPDL